MGQQACSNCSVCGDDAVARAGSREYGASPAPFRPQRHGEGTRSKEPVHFNQEAPEEAIPFIASTPDIGAPPECPAPVIDEAIDCKVKATEQGTRQSWQETVQEVVASTEAGLENIAKHISEDVDAVGNQCEKIQDKVNSAVEDVVRTTINALEDFTGTMLTGQLEKVVSETLDFLGPQCGNHCVDKMWEQYPKLQKVDDGTKSVDIKGKATESAVKVVQSFRDSIIEFCKDVVERIQAGMDIVTAAFKTLRKVCVMICKALFSGVEAAVKRVKAFVPGLCVKCGTSAFKKLIQQCYDFLKGVTQTFVQDQLKDKGVPTEVTNEVDWSVIEHTSKLKPPKAKDNNFSGGDRGATTTADKFNPNEDYER